MSKIMTITQFHEAIKGRKIYVGVVSFHAASVWISHKQAEVLFDRAGGDIDLLDEGDRLYLSGHGRTWRGRIYE